MNNFDFAFEYTIKDEGGYSNDPDDSGGPTNLGIIQSEYSKWIGRSASIAEMKALTKEQVKPIYKKNYWLPLCCDKIDSCAIATCIFNIGVNRGIGWPPKRIQAICMVEQDGHIGPLTLKALNEMSDSKFITEFERVVEKSYQSIVDARPSQRTFIKGWLRRARRLLTLIGGKNEL